MGQLIGSSIIIFGGATAILAYTADFIGGVAIGGIAIMAGGILFDIDMRETPLPQEVPRENQPEEADTDRTMSKRDTTMTEANSAGTRTTERTHTPSYDRYQTGRCNCGERKHDTVTGERCFNCWGGEDV